MDIFSLLWTVINSLLSVIKMLLPLGIPVLLLILFIVLSYIYNLFYLRVIKGIKRKPLVKFIKNSSGEVTTEPFIKTYKEPSIFKKLLIMLPKQLAIDSINRDPNAFEGFGIHMFCGQQGSGKTIAMVYMLNKWRQQYPNLELYTNMDYQYENGSIEHWKQLVKRSNGIYGVVNALDEIHSWLSMESGKVSPALLGEISQQRKQKKAILGTAQVFGKIPKELREQTHFVYMPRTILGVLTIVRKASPSDYDMDKNKFRRYKGFFIFVHDKELRESYDTYKRISSYADNEFSKNEFLSTEG